MKGVLNHCTISYEDTKILPSVQAPINFLTLDLRIFSVYVDI